VEWRDIWAGAIFTAVLFTIGKWAIGLYISKTNAGAAYGAGGAIIIILLWVYYSSLILLFGAHYTYAKATENGRHITPGKRAVLVER
jgi:membrane protein